MSEHQWMTKGNTNTIRAFAAITIMYCHMHWFLPEIGTLFSLVENIGYLAVGIFYFYVGYNIVNTLVSKWIDGFILSKVKRVYLPYVIASIIHYAIIHKDMGYTTGDLFKSFIGIKLINTTLWYCCSVCLIYLLVFIVAFALELIIKDKAKTKLMIGIIIVIAFFIYTFIWTFLSNQTGVAIGPNERYPLSFLAGAFTFFSREKLYDFVSKYKITLIVVFMLATSFFYKHHILGDSLVIGGIDLYVWLAPLSASILANILICDEDTGHQFHKIGNISYEIYILHLSVLTICTKLVPTDRRIVFILIYTIAIFVSAEVFQNVYRIVWKKFEK